METEKGSTSELLEKVVTEHQRDTISVGELKNSLHERGFGILLAIASLPLCVPVPVPPGYTTVFAVPLFIFALQMIAGLDSPWIPKWLAGRQVRRKTLATILEKATPVLRKIEKLLRPRFTFIEIHTWERVVGVFSFIFALSIAIPLPLTNLPPGYGILIMSLGLLGKDGLTIFIGIIIGLVGVVITGMILILSKEAVINTFSFFFSQSPQ